jgi:hypothetical protein
MNEQALIDELKQPQYATMSDQEAADAVNAKTVTIRQPVAAERVQASAISTGLWAIVKIAAQNTALPNPPRGAAMSFVDWIEAGRPIDMDGGTVQGVGQVLLSYNLATQPQLDALQALADTAARWVDVQGIGEVGIGFVINARRAIAGGA